jgi:Flp pilus assembly protein TadD
LLVIHQLFVCVVPAMPHDILTIHLTTILSVETSPMRRFAISFFLLAASSVACLAAGDAPAPEETATAPAALSAKALGCKSNELGVWQGEGTNRKQACIEVQTATATDEEFYEQGKLLATEGEYDWSLAVLARISKQDDANVLNYMGYNHRKAGRLETGIAAYKKALTLDPNHVQARAYLGEAYVLAGLKDLASAELKEIETRCGKNCPPYKELEKALAEN